MIADVREGSTAELSQMMTGFPAELTPDPRISRTFDLMRGEDVAAAEQQRPALWFWEEKR